MIPPVPRPPALDPKLLGLFFDDAVSLLGEFDAGAAAFGEGVDDAEIRRSLFRSARRLAEDALMLGFTEIAAVAEPLEAALDEYRRDVRRADDAFRADVLAARARLGELLNEARGRGR